MASQCFIELEPFINKGLSNPANQKILEAHVKKYMGENAPILAKSDLHECPGFSREADQGVLFQCMGTTRAQFADVLKRTTNRDVRTGWRMFQNEMYLACTMAVRYFVKTNNKRMAELIGIFFGVWLYSSLHRKYWEFGNNEAAMAYTINNLSNKFDLKKLGSVIAVLKKISDSNLANAKSRLVSKSDDDIFVYARDYRTRCNSFIKNIAKEYYDNLQNGRYMVVDKATGIDEEGEEYAVERTSDSGAIFSASESFEIWFMTNRLNERLLRTISSLTPEISPAKLANTLNSIKADNKGRIRRVLAGMLGSLMEVQKDNSLRAIHSKEFPIFCVRILSKSNSKNELVIGMKKAVDDLLMDYCDTFRKTKREASRINYRKAIVLYFAMALQIQRK